MTRWRSERGTALLEAAMTVPIILLICVGIFEFGRAYQTWQIVTNAAREGARVSVLPNASTSTVEARIRSYMQDGMLSEHATAGVNVDRSASVSLGGQNASASLITVDYPFQFMVLQPVANLVVPGSTLGSPLNMRATALMRNEAQ